VALVAVSALWWFWWVPTWRPPLRANETYGIDVSAHQGDIDWDLVASDDIDFAYAKASEGGDLVDERYVENAEGAREAGLRVGAYHFYTLCTSPDPQAANFLDVAPPDPDMLPPAVDLELAGNCSERPAPERVDAELNRFLGIVEEAWGRHVLLYVGDDWNELYHSRERFDRPLWERRFLLRPDEERWAIWQLHGYARVEGIEGGVDLDVMRGDPELR
jgi:lysozyme